ncbi:MAG TPA: DHH family phosphoesterase [Elusimicrobiota bacterium]|nr:DHH family phosphoesterase [Elusimicrobiota bacterium]
MMTPAAPGTKYIGRARHARALLRHLVKKGKRLGPLLIVTHDHPDPDAMASAWSLAHLAQNLCRIRTRIVYGGMIGRRENRIMAESLGVPAHPLRKGELAEYEHAALVDTQAPFRNNRFPPRRHPDILIDHHQRHPDTAADLAIIDESVGATTTLLGEALLLSGVRVPPALATAIVYGIGSETQNLGREAGRRDADVYRAFMSKANMRDLWRIANPRRPASFFQTLARSIREAFVVRGIIGVNLGPIAIPDQVAQTADFLLTHERMQWSIATGRFNGRLHVSLRTHDTEGAAGRLLKKLLGGGNRGGGHRMIAGGSQDVGADAPESTWREAEEAIVSAFLRSRGVQDPTQREYPFRSESREEPEIS